MERLPVGVVSEVLACLSASEIASLVSCGRAWHSLVMSMGCLSTRARYVKPVGDVRRYRRNLLLGPAPGTAGGVTLRLSVKLYRSFLARKLMLQSLVVQGEHDAATWLALSYAMEIPNRKSSSLSAFRSVPWDFALYTILCNALELCSLPRLSLYVSSVPAIVDRGERLPISSQAFLCHLLLSATTKVPLLYLHLCGAVHGTPHVPVSADFVDSARQRVDEVFREAEWSEKIHVYPLHDFRSSTVALGRVLATADPRLTGLRVSCYVFDEMAPSRDISSLSSYFRWGAHELVRVNFHRLDFSSGEEFCHLLASLCKVSTLQSVRLSCIECLTDPPDDPLSILFEEGGHIRDLCLRDVARLPANVPFHLIEPPGYRCLALKQMFLDTSNLQQLLTRLPFLTNLVTVDLSCNGVDGTVLGLFARVLKEKECKIQRLKLASNIITGSVVPFFCQALRVNRTLQNLDLGDNFLGTLSSLKILQTVISTKDSPLKYLNLDGNQVRYRVEDLSRILLASERSDVFRQVSLKANPRLMTPDPHDNVDNYNYFFKSHYNVSFLF